MKARIASLLELLEWAEGLKRVPRATYLVDQSRRENSAEHTWHMALYALFFARELDVPIDLERTLTMILIHDLAEIEVGDASVYSEAYDQMKAAERAEMQARLATLPDDLRDWLTDCWLDFESGESPEARLAHAVDRLQALAQNVFSGGRAWAARRVREDMSRTLNLDSMRFDPALAAAFETLYERAAQEGLWPEEERRAAEDKERRPPGKPSGDP
jgi:putative hydrolase of HD superfamily